MRLTVHTDYALRALIFLATAGEGGATAAAMAQAYGVSRHHLVKVLQHLRDLELVETVRGRGGGVRLAKAPEDIRIGAVVRETEADLGPAECFAPKASSTCPIAQICLLKPRLGEAVEAYLAVLDGYPGADVAANRRVLIQVLGPAM
jgi:Rrf2 family transcriptional regulator, nitric oxide-sensitive transcriptional repressor